MKVMMFGSDTGAPDGKTHIHCRRYIHLLRLAGCGVTFVERRGIQLPKIPNVSYRRYPRRYRRFEKLLGTGLIYRMRDHSMRRLWRRVKPDVCHVQWIDDQLWHIGRAGLRPLVATAWGSDLNLPARAPADNALRKQVAAGLRQLDLLIVDSEDMVATAESIARKSLKTKLLPIGIDTGQFRPGLQQLRKEWREKLQISPDATVLISARQLGANYRPAEIIRAFAGLDRRVFGVAYLIIRAFGHRLGVSLADLHRLADELNVSSRLRWVGDVEYSQLPGLYAAADLAINFPIIDAFPVTFLECFSSGLPVVTNRLTSYASNGALSYLYCAEDDSVVGLTRAVGLAIDRLDQLKSVAAKAREHVVRNYDERITAQALRQEYEDLLASSDRRSRRASVFLNGSEDAM